MGSMDKPCFSTGANTDLVGFASACATVVQDARVVAISADILESGGVAEVGVDPDDLTTVASSDALHVDIALALAAALLGQS